MNTIIRILLFVSFFLTFINISISQEDQSYLQIDKPELIKEEADFKRLNNSEKEQYLPLFDELTEESIWINKLWLNNNPDKVNFIDDNVRMSYINTYSQSILVNQDRMVNSALIATLKTFPRPFRPKKSQNTQVVAEKPAYYRSEVTNLRGERINTTLEVVSFRIIEFKESNIYRIPKKYIELCFNRKLINEKICVIFYIEFQSGEIWIRSSEIISEYDITQGNCLYEDIINDSKRLGNSIKDTEIKKSALKEDNIKSLRVEVYDRCWESNDEKEGARLISTTQIK